MHLIVFCVPQESNGPSDAYAAISNADRLQAEPESLRKWREEQSDRLELLGKHRPECVKCVSRPVIHIIVPAVVFTLSSLHLLFPFPRSSPSTDENSRKQESEWKEKAKVELEEWHARQNEQLEKTKTNNRYWLHRGGRNRT